MMSRYDIPWPPTRLMASSSRRLSYDTGSLDRRRTRAEHRQHVAGLEQLRDDLFEQLAHERRLGRGEVQIVDQQDEDPPGGVGGGLARGRMMPSAASPRAGSAGEQVEHAAAIDHHQRRHLSARRRLRRPKSSLSRSGTNWPVAVRGMTSSVTRLTATRKFGGWRTATRRLSLADRRPDAISAASPRCGSDRSATRCGRMAEV